ncbi:MAG: hydantoinase/oxoprolinase family protein [Acidobacteriota bacterium]|nr:hydantoinase/oxoprolinase family protein [Acidobacteriota bacterium]
MRIAIDTGGTFTDCVYLKDGRIEVLKIRSTPQDPSLAVVQAVRQVSAGERAELRHGTTVGTNAMLERKGARVAFVTTAGFEDTIAIGRQTRQRLYDWFAPEPVCLVEKALRFGLAERVSAEGEVLRAPSKEELAELVEGLRTSGAEAVAISLLFSFVRPEHEQQAEDALSTLGIPVSASHRILPEFREYERGATTVVNAYLSPKMRNYLLGLESGVRTLHAENRVDVMQSSGGIVSARLAAREPVRTILSGPAGGVMGAMHVARLAGFERIIGFDMGGTSTDVFLADLTTGGAMRTNEAVVADVPVSVPMLDIHTAGAGGGSLARFDAGGLLRVGPESAGADPGPMCFGRGEQATVTDANLLLGRLDENSFLGGAVTLDVDRTRHKMDEQKGALATAEEFAAGIVSVVETAMEKAIRVISVERGYDPRDFTLVAFGGGGPLHACSMARALRIPRVLVPALPGALSAVGILLADVVRDYSRTVMLPGDALASAEVSFAKLEEQARTEFAAEGLNGKADRTVDVRYRRQGYELNVAFDAAHPEAAAAAFHALHQKRYGFSDTTKPIEIVNVRVRMTAKADAHEPVHDALRSEESPKNHGERKICFDGAFVQTQVYRRENLRAGMRVEGPAMVTEYTSATIVPPEWKADVDGFGNLVLMMKEGAK